MKPIASILAKMFSRKDVQPDKAVYRGSAAPGSIAYDTMNPFETVKQLLFKFSDLGVEEDKWATLIGKAPHIAEMAWLNRIYTPISSDDIAKIEKETNKIIPPVFAEFLTKYSNGLGVLNTTFNIYGYRFNYSRALDAPEQPYNIIELNQFMKPKNATKDMFFFGTYNWDLSFLYMTPDQRVHFCKREDATSLYSWDSFYDMLISEIERLYTLFDDKGVKKDKKQPTIPVY